MATGVRTISVEQCNTLSVFDEDNDQIESFSIKYQSSPILATYDRPVVIDLAADASLDFFFVRSFDRVYGVLGFSDISKVKFQIYDDSDVAQFIGSYGTQFSLVGSQAKLADIIFNYTDHKDWYLKVTNQNTVNAKITVVALGLNI